MYRPFIIRRDRTVTDRTTGDNIAQLHLAQSPAQVRGMYYVDLAPGITDEYTEVHMATPHDLDEAHTAIIPDAIHGPAAFPSIQPRLYFRTQEKAARFAYDYQASRRARSN